MLSFISILTINCSLLTLIISNELYNLIHLYIAINVLMLTYLFLNESKLVSIHIKTSKLYNPSRIGFIISLLFGLVAIGKKHLIPISQTHIWLSSIIIFFVVVYLVYTISKINKIEALKSNILIYSFTCLVLIPILFSPAISGAIVIVLLSFLVNYKTGLTIGIIALIYFISQFYYDLNFTLLTKSILLFSSGIIFLLCYLFTTKKRSSNEKI